MMMPDEYDHIYVCNLLQIIFKNSCSYRFYILTCFVILYATLFGVQLPEQQHTALNRSQKKCLVANIHAMQYVLVRTAVFTDKCHALSYRKTGTAIRLGSCYPCASLKALIFWGIFPLPKQNSLSFQSEGQSGSTPERILAAKVIKNKENERRNFVEIL